jgi:hypothetical protein
VKRLGPDLKMPDLKAPTFLADLFWDLRERRLLPLLALVVVAIAAVPFALKGKSHGEAQPAEPVAGAVASVASSGSSRFVVVQAKPGLRDYRKRLAHHRTPHNPFKPHLPRPVKTHFGLPSEGSAGSSGSGPTFTTGPETPTSPSGSSPGEAPPSTSPPSTGGAPPKPHLVLFSWAIKVKITKSGGKSDPKKKPESTVQDRVLPQTPLPNEKQPVVTYMSVSKKGKPLLLVSDGVSSVFGEAHCVSGEGVCQLLEVEPGFPVSLVYGPNEVHYTINVLKVGLVIVGRR